MFGLLAFPKIMNRNILESGPGKLGLSISEEILVSVEVFFKPSVALTTGEFAIYNIFIIQTIENNWPSLF